MKYLLVFSFCAGCGLTYDLDSVPLDPLDSSAGSIDSGADLPLGQICSDPTAGTFDDSACDPVQQTGCAGGQNCGLALKNGSELAAACRSDDEAVDGPGESCSATTCVAGFHCVNIDGGFRCEKLCRRENALGCDAGSFCTAFQQSKIGWCSPVCRQ